MAKPSHPLSNEPIARSTSTRDRPETLSPVTGQGVAVSDYVYPRDTSLPQPGAPGAGIDVAAPSMPVTGALEVHDTDEEMLEAERLNSQAAGYARPGEPEQAPIGAKDTASGPKASGSRGE